MSNIPTEGTWAGDILAAMTVLAPISSLLASAFIRPKVGAFLSAILISGSIIFLGVWMSYDANANHSALGPTVFAGWAGLISVGLALVITIGRSIITSPVVESTNSVVESPDSDDKG